MAKNSFTIYSIIKRNAERYCDSIGWIHGEKKVTHGFFKKCVDRLAYGLTNLGIVKGDRICVIDQNSLEYTHIYGAAAKIGAVVLPINWRLKQQEIEFLISDCRPKILFFGFELQELIESIKPKFGFIRKFISLGFVREEFIPICDLMVKGSEKENIDCEVEPDDDYVIIHTAAVDGKPRGAVLTQGNFIAANIQSMYEWKLVPKDCNLCMLPMFHMMGLIILKSVMHAGGCNVIMPKFKIDTALELIEEHKVSIFAEFPPMLATMLEKNRKKQTNISSVRIIIGLDSEETILEYEKISGGKFWVCYGQTETTGIVTYGIYNSRSLNSGKAGIISEIAIMDENGSILKEDQEGEIIVRGPLMFKGYRNLKNETEYVSRDGWHHTGDIGKIDRDGYLFFNGRKQEKDLIKSGGENVYPIEVEKVILEHPLVEDVCVIGVADVRWGEAVKAVCVLKKEAKDTKINLAEFVKDKIAAYKKPQYVSFVDELPKNQKGDIDREAVKVAYSQD